MWNSSVFSILFNSLPLISVSDYVVNTKYGQIEGVPAYSRFGKKFAKFLGIPFAAPPVGHLRFESPQPPEPWEGIRDGSAYGPKCSQCHLIIHQEGGQEDCLYLNVFTRQYRKTDGKTLDNLNPVMVFIHGGFFMHGRSHIYETDFFMDRDIVMVTIEYRVGALGFLNLGNEAIRGNMGLKDQSMALKWIKENIENFGGDPNSVTIMGQSAGATSVHYHLLSPMSRGLFHKAISQSGNAFSSWCLERQPVEEGFHFAEQINCTGSNVKAVIECLKSRPVDDIISYQCRAKDPLHDRFDVFSPSIEMLDDEESFISQHPVDIVKSSNFSNVPWIIGVNSDDGLLFAGPILRNETLKTEVNFNWTRWLPNLMRYDGHPREEFISNKIMEYYFDNETCLNETFWLCEETLPQLSMLLSDRYFFEGFHNTLKLHAKTQTIYPYAYFYKGEFSFSEILLSLSYDKHRVADFALSYGWKWIQKKIFGHQRNSSLGVGHGDELPLMFKLPLSFRSGRTAPDIQMSIEVIRIWTHFATHGEPPANITWPAAEVSDEKRYFNLLKIDSEFQLLEEPYADRMRFWKCLGLWPVEESQKDPECVDLNYSGE